MAKKTDLTTKSAPAGPTAIVQAERAKTALEMRRDGGSYSDIAKALGTTIPKVQEIVRNAIQAIPEEAANEMRALAAARLDQALQKAMDELDVYEKETREFRANNGLAGKIPHIPLLIDLQDHVLRIEAQRAKLFGLNAAVKVEGSGVALVGIADLLKAQEAMDSNQKLKEECAKMLEDKCLTPPQQE